MSRIKELRTNEDYNLNIVSILEMFSPEGKSKYTETLLRMMKNTPNLKEHTKEIKLLLVDKFPFIEKSKLDLMSDIQMMLLYKFIDGFFNTEDLQKYRKFCEYNERNLIEENDLTKYKSFEQMIAAMGVAEMKSEDPEVKKLAVASRDFIREQVLDKKVLLKSHKPDKYGRALADVWSLNDDWTPAPKTLSEMMIEKGIKTNNEFYVAPTYNFLISQGWTIETSLVGNHGEAVHGLGIPSDLGSFLKISEAEEIAKCLKKKLGITP